MIERDNFIRNS